MSDSWGEQESRSSTIRRLEGMLLQHAETAQQLRAKVAFLENEINSFRDSASQARSHRDELQRAEEARVALEKRVASLSASLDGTRRQAREEAARASRAETKLNLLTDATDLSEEEIHHWRASLQSMESTAESLWISLQRCLESSSNGPSPAASALDSRSTGAMSRISSPERLHGGGFSHSHRVLGFLHQCQSMTEELSTRVSSLYHTTRRRSIDSVEQESELENLRRQLQAKEEALVAASRGRDQARRQQRQLEQTVERLEQDVAEARTSAVHTTEERRRQTGALRSENETLQREVGRCQRRVADAERLAERSRDDMQRLLSSQEGQADGKDEKIAELEQLVQRRAQEVAEAYRAPGNAEQRVEQAQTDNSALANAMDEARRECEQLEHNVEEEKSKTERALAREREAAYEKARLERRVRQLEAQVQEAEDARQAADNKARRAQEEGERSMAELYRRSEQCESLREELEAAVLVSMRVQNAQAVDGLRQTQSAVKVLHARLEEAKEANEALQHQLEESELVHRRAQQSWEDASRAHERERSRLEDRVRYLEEQLEYFRGMDVYAVAFQQTVRQWKGSSASPRQWKPSTRRDFGDDNTAMTIPSETVASP